MQPVQPIIVQVVDQPAQELGIGQTILQALGLTGLILLASFLVGAILGAAIIYWRQRQARERIPGEAGDQIRLRLEPPKRSVPQVGEAGCRPQ